MAVTGPRQSGNTTLVQTCFPEKPYVTLEDLDQLEFATHDPRGFLAQYPVGAVLDEVQRCPGTIGGAVVHRRLPAHLELKSGGTVNADFFGALQSWRQIAGKEAGTARLLYGGDQTQTRQGVQVLPWRQNGKLAAEL